MATQKHTGTLMPIQDGRIDLESQFYLAGIAKKSQYSGWVVAFDTAVHAPGGTSEDIYRYAFISPDQLSLAAKQGVLADGKSRRVTVGVDRLKRGLIAFECMPLIV